MGRLLLLVIALGCGCGVASASTGTATVATVTSHKTPHKTIRHIVYHAPPACQKMGKQLVGALTKIGSAAHGFSGLILPAYLAGLRNQQIPSVIDKESAQNDKVVAATAQVKEALRLAPGCFGLRIP